MAERKQVIIIQDNCIDSEEKWRVWSLEIKMISLGESGMFHEEGGDIVSLSVDLRV